MRLDMGDCTHPDGGSCASCLQVGHLPLIDTLAELARTTADGRGLAFATGFPIGSWESTLPVVVWSGVQYLQQARAKRGDRPLPRADLLIEALTGFLLIHHDFNAASEGCSDYAHEVRTAARYAEQLLGMTDAPVELKKGVPCKRCRAMLLVQRAGQDITCAGCGKVYRRDEYTDWVAEYEKPKRVVRRRGQLPEEAPSLQADRMREVAVPLSQNTDTRRIAGHLMARADELLQPATTRSPFVDRHAAPSDLLAFLAKRMTDEGNPAARDVEAIRARPGAALSLALEWRDHPDFRDEWIPRKPTSDTP
jgi:hypothetical protein